MALFKFTIYSPYVGADVVEEVEIDDEDLEGLTEEEREDHINAVLKDWVEVNVEYDWQEIKED